MTPACRIEIDGAQVHGEFMRRLISCSVSDAEGVSSDSCNIVLNDWPCAEIPRTGALISIFMGYEGALAFMGRFTVEDVSVQMFEHQMTITGRAAEMGGKVKEGKERHWDDKTLKDIVSEVAADHGLSPMVDDEIGQFSYPWLGQMGESDIHFLERLAERHGALMSVKDGKLIFASKASGKSASGSALTPITITPDILSPGSGQVQFSDRTKSGKVKASYTDRGKGKKVEIEEESDPNGKADYVLTEQYADEDEARAAAKSMAGDLLRRQATFSCSIPGNPTARAGAPLTFRGCRPGVDGIPFIIKSATHNISKSGYTTDLSGESQSGPKGGG
ncbi:phage late control D family protein [Castellaniella sp.]|uniref:phage late control D family protein n=1 Tax=Castellaniella sp. TaxID=1955812 RepID=UPI002AFF2AA9|nr:contractile injection system protein, VgrG/Pvc8 family [Castellaniella sp.]